MLELGGKSPWGNREVAGYIIIKVKNVKNSRSVEFYPLLVDGVHGINVVDDSYLLECEAGHCKPNLKNSKAFDLKKSDSLVRGDIKMTGAGYNYVSFSSTMTADTSIRTLDGYCPQSDGYALNGPVGNGICDLVAPITKCVEV